MLNTIIGYQAFARSMNCMTLCVYWRFSTPYSTLMGRHNHGSRVMLPFVHSSCEGMRR